MRKFLINGVLMLLLITDGSMPAQAASYLGGRSLCLQGELEYFTCELQGSNKIASVCAADNVSPDHGYVQYRFGRHDKIEYKFPGKLIPPRKIFSIVDVSRLPDGLGSHIKFVNGDYVYVVSNALVPGEIYVARDGKIVLDEICKGSTYIPFDNAARQGLEYGVVGKIDRIDQHNK